MGKINESGSAYICPMHASIRQASPGKCPKCGMALVPENARFALLRHMARQLAPSCNHGRDHGGGDGRSDDDDRALTNIA